MHYNEFKISKHQQWFITFSNYIKNFNNGIKNIVSKGKIRIIERDNGEQR